MMQQSIHCAGRSRQIPSRQALTRLATSCDRFSLWLNLPRATLASTFMLPSFCFRTHRVSCVACMNLKSLDNCRTACSPDEEVVNDRVNLDRAAGFTVVKQAQVASLPWTDFCKLWKDYMVVMAECLVEAAGVVASPPGQRLAHLVYETGAG